MANKWKQRCRDLQQQVGMLQMRANALTAQVAMLEEERDRLHTLWVRTVAEQQVDTQIEAETEQSAFLRGVEHQKKRYLAWAQAEMTT